MATKPKAGLILLGLLLAFALPALAEVYALPPIEYTENIAEGEPWDHEAYTLLVNGDTTHFLKYRYGGIVNGPQELDVLGAVCYALDDSGEAVPCPDGCGEIFADIEEYHLARPFFGLVTTPDNVTYLVDAAGQVLRWTPGGAESWEHVVQLDFSGVRELPSIYDSTDYAADEDALYIAFNAYQQACELYAFDWETGARRLVANWGYTYDMIPAGPGKLLVDGSPRPGTSSKWYLMDTRTGVTEVLTQGTTMVKTTYCVWDRADGWYYASYNDIQRLGPDGEESTVASFANDSRAAGYLALSLDGQRFYLLQQDGDATFRVIERPESGRTLTIGGYTNYLDPRFGTVSSMAGDDPALQGVQFDLRDGLTGAGDVAQLLLTRSDAVDVLIVSPGSVDLRSLFLKGYFVPLEDDPAIASFASRLYPAWQEACLWEDHVAALPLYVYDSDQFMVNATLWQEHGLTPPTGYRELFAAIREMDSLGLLAEYPLFEQNGWDTRSFNHIANKLLTDYLLCAGDDPRFDDPTLLALLEELSDLRDLLDRHDERRLTGSPLMIHDGFVTSAILSNHGTLYDEEAYEPILLALDESRGPVLQCHLTVLMVNPYSQNIELAKAWLSHLASSPTELTQCVFLTGMPEGIETERSRAQRAEYEARAAELQRRLEDAQTSGDPEAVEEVRELMLQNVRPLESWIVSPERAARLYRVLPYARVARYDAYAVLDNGEQPIQEYLDGKRSARELVQALDALAAMIGAE